MMSRSQVEDKEKVKAIEITLFSTTPQLVLGLCFNRVSGSGSHSYYDAALEGLRQSAALRFPGVCPMNRSLLDCIFSSV